MKEHLHWIKRMLGADGDDSPELDGFTARELALDEIAGSLDGGPDGWCCMEVGGTQAR